MAHTVCLNMVVSAYDTHVLKVLESAKAHIDHWLVASEGLADPMLDAIESLMGDIPGEVLHVEPAVRADQKNALLEYSRELGDYVLCLEPHQLLLSENANLADAIGADAHFIKIDMPVQRKNLCLIRNDGSWAFHGAACEQLLSTRSGHYALTENLTIHSLLSKSQFKEQCDREHSALKLSNESGDRSAHCLFHLAKTAMQLGNWQEARDYFVEYLDGKNHWDDEWQWYALYHIAKLSEKLGATVEQIEQEYLAAYRHRSIRAEPMYELARIKRQAEDMSIARLYSSMAFRLALPSKESYDLETAIYEWHTPYEHMLNSQHFNDHAEALEAAAKALQSETIKLIGKNNVESLLFHRQPSVDAVFPKIEWPPSTTRNSNRIRLVVPFRNAGEHLRKSIDTICSQDYSNFTATFIDDNSTDNSADLVPIDDPRVELIRNNKRVGPLVNRYEFIMRCDPDDIVVYLDGDDQLASDDALSYINQIYQQTDCWLSYGQYVTQKGYMGFAQPYANHKQLMIELESGMMRFPMHPITHRAGLMHRLQEFDPELTCMKDEQGEWLFYASDAVLVRPLFFMAGRNKIHYCSRVLYLYTEGHEISESIDNKQDQIDTCRIIAKKLRPPSLTHYR